MPKKIYMVALNKKKNLLKHRICLIDVVDTQKIFS
jgi:hypothetical protein